MAPEYSVDKLKFENSPWKAYPTNSMDMFGAGPAVP